MVNDINLFRDDYENIHIKIEENTDSGLGFSYNTDYFNTSDRSNIYANINKR